MAKQACLHCQSEQGHTVSTVGQVGKSKPTPSTHDETPLCFAQRCVACLSALAAITFPEEGAGLAAPLQDFLVYPLHYWADGKKTSRNLSSCAADPTEGTVMPPPLNCEEGGGGGSTSEESAGPAARQHSKD